LARVPDRLLQATGIAGWAPALVVVIAAVNGARALAQAPFALARRDGSMRRWGTQAVTVLCGAVAIGAALTLPLYALIRVSPLWWLWAWMMFAAVTVAAQVAMPWILRAQAGPSTPAPEALSTQARAVAAHAGVDIGPGVLIAGTARRRGRGGNAYVVGLGPTRRVVLDADLAAWPPQLIDQVVAHELGHWRLGHTARRLPLTLFVQLVTFALAAAVLSQPPVLAIAGVVHAGDPRSYPLLLALTAALVLPARVVLAAYDRSQELAADRFALSTLAAPGDFAAMLERAADDGGAARRLPWWRHLTASHPPIDQRLRAAANQRSRQEEGVRR
jgi:STE24 endopeptidase